MWSWKFFWAEVIRDALALIGVLAIIVFMMWEFLTWGGAR